MLRGFNGCDGECIWLCNPENWKNYKMDNVAEYVIGSPSVEMFSLAYNEWKKDETVKFKFNMVSERGYALEKDYGLEAGPGSVFVQKDYVWLCSPIPYEQTSIPWGVDEKGRFVGLYGSDARDITPIAAILTK